MSWVGGTVAVSPRLGGKALVTMLLIPGTLVRVVLGFFGTLLLHFGDAFSQPPRDV